MGLGIVAILVVLVIIEHRLGKIQGYLRMLVARSEPEDDPDDPLDRYLRDIKPDKPGKPKPLV